MWEFSLTKFYVMASFLGGWTDVPDDHPAIIGSSWKEESDDPNPIQPLPLEQQLDQLTNKERLLLFDKYCRDCGDKHPESCSCKKIS